MDLTRKFKADYGPQKRPKRNPSETPSSLPSSHPPRRSSRLVNVARVTHQENKRPIKNKELKPLECEESEDSEGIEIYVEEGPMPEIYTEEHLKLVGDCKTAWTLFSEGYGEDGEREYDEFNLSCHQCRQKTRGHRTNCSCCRLGSFCGDCLYMGYGENVLEANQNKNWTCPKCRGICICSRCRKDKGWKPIGDIYTKVSKLGFKSVGHYLIQTRQSEPKQVFLVDEDELSAAGSPTTNPEIILSDDEVSRYEQLIQQRIKDNLERLKKLGVMDLTRKFKADYGPQKRPKRNPSETPSSLPSSHPPRRSSRLVNVARVTHQENKRPIKNKELKPLESEESEDSEGIEIYVEEGPMPEIYTEEHLKLLGDCKTAWTLFSEGYGEDGEREYDEFNLSCHQCRQKTRGHRTNCSCCRLGSFCGDCLYMGYGENVLEANQNKNWTCPKCRGICICSRCRKDKGWKPIGDIYTKVSKLGFKSVGHYLIQTRQSEPKQVFLVDEDELSAAGSPTTNPEIILSDDEVCRYEQLIQQRIKDNLERLKKLGVMDLTRKFKADYGPQKRPKRNPSETPSSLPSSHPPRRSSRLVNVARVTHQENKRPIKNKELKPLESEESEDSEGIEIYVEEGPMPEIYTEEHLKLLGDCKTAWTLFSEGYGEDGEREYDEFNLSCHQCRQKTRGHRTNCSCCRLGSFCGDCLYMGYGENVLEANQNKNWTCPKCRGICICSRCRKDKGWKPIGDIYTKVLKLGFKSVGHYLIQTRQSEPKQVFLVDEDELSAAGSPTTNPEIILSDDEVSRYEQLIQQRIKDNLERLQKLGVMDLTRKFKADYGPQKRPKRNPSETPSSLPSSHPPRRSSRLVNVARVTHQENKRPIKNKELKPLESEESEDSEGIEIYVEEGPMPEIYTEEHLKLLGDCKTAWTLFSEGYGEDGEREYDEFNLSCHQCRQKTRGHRTNCSCCRLGSFCGDCLYMGYGENVLEANQNKNWTCPKCRGICICSRCRKDKGWKPIGDIYTKVSKLGFKSVGHYLIQTRQSEPKQVFLVDEDELSAAGSPTTNPEIILSDDEVSRYEQLIQQRIKDNLERLKKLGVMDLTRKFKADYGPQKRPKRNPSETPSSLPSSHPPRRSSRLVNVARVTHQENKRPIKNKELKPLESEESEDSEGIEIYVEEGPMPEIYTEEHLKLLGDCKTAWTLFSEGYGEDGEREYDEFNLSCHQCRQKTRGHRTNCSCCRLGSFCGDCLYMGYGENVLEANQNKNWTCPKCRGICICSRCRKDKGWKPIGDIYTKVSKLGFKSVGHYLIQTRQSEPKQVFLVDEDELSAAGSPTTNPEIILSDDEVSRYEQLIQQRIKDNLERLKKLGVMDLTRKFKADYGPQKRPKRNPSETPSSLPSSHPPRRSSRLVNVARVTHQENKRPIKNKELKPLESEESEDSEGIEIYVEEGPMPEIYTEEHLKLLGDCKTAWTLFSEGYGEDGEREYDEFNLSCHQCRQKTRGHRTNCSCCRLGSFCGDCLYMGYGENVLEANQNKNWTCPKCRGICICSRCRKDKGWKPIGDIYTKVLKLGFKSVGHYLIQTRQSEPKQVFLVDEDELSAAGSPTTNPEIILSDDEVSRYEQLIQQRIKDNLERLQKLGVMDLTRKFKADYGPQKRPKRNPSETPSSLPSSHPPRRSSRLVNVARVTHQENKRPIKNKELKPLESEESEDSEGIEIYVEEGPMPEIYTEEHLKLLGDCKTAWTLFSEGYGEDGEREYDEFNLSCHQCRQKTRGHRTNCSCCRLGSFCGDCLYMGYGENVLEANQNKNWTCPKCRGICICSRCRKDKGWKPIGDIYTKVLKLGFKSVGHYLIQTRQSEPKQVFLVDEDELSAAGSPTTNPEIILSDDEVSRYEQLIQQRIKDNLERLQKLGVMDLTRKFKADYGPQKRPKRNPSETPSSLPSSHPPRRSSRLVNVARVTHQENKRPIKNKELKPLESEESEDSEGIEIYVEEGPMPEIYTEEHLKLLGDCKTAWTLFSEGYGEDGEREYDEFNLSCHQCRQKTRGHRTNCSCCRLGSFCGDCLYMGYGENVLEANQNKNWTCPKCRGICICSRCRKDKGWKPIGDIYTKVSKLGFKSVGHYLIQTRQSEPKQVFLVDEDELSAAGSPTTNPEIILSDDEKNTGKHSDDEYAEEDEAHNETDDGDDEDSDIDD